MEHSHPTGHSFLPTFAIFDAAGQHDNKRAREVFACIAESEVVVFDKAYVEQSPQAGKSYQGLVLGTSSFSWSGVAGFEPTASSSR